MHFKLQMFTHPGLDVSNNITWCQTHSKHVFRKKKTWQVACTAEEGSHVSAFSFIFLGYLPYLAVVVMVGGLYVLLYQVGLHGNEKVTRCAVGGFHLPHEVLHAKIFTRKRAGTAISDH